MLLRNSISSTKKFFNKTFQSFKSLLSGGYQKLPQTPPFNPFFYSSGDMDIHQSFRELDNFYTDFTNRWESDKCKSKKKNKKKIKSAKQPMKEEDVYKGSFVNFAKQSPVKSKKEERREGEKKIISTHEREREGESCSYSGNYLVAQKLKELEMMDVSNIDHVLDIEEVLHYYSRLTCPVYLDIINKFFMEIYSEFFLPQASVGNYNSRPRLRSMKVY
ncbi:hypothetical protein HHK36_006168 [Tetracentron sinense]|uniref:OVATE domain-containing protein n=1 Tax=Tetracentron sinense TaxID=13715 RepID=A0A835DJZ4_TETSI|nr:hypothetical protein HHK36_006168 [Tetracentron sinense]